METKIIKIQIIAQLIVKHRQAIQTRKKHNDSNKPDSKEQETETISISDISEGDTVKII